MLSPGQFLGLFHCLALLYGTFPYYMGGWLASSVEHSLHHYYTVIQAANPLLISVGFVYKKGTNPLCKVETTINPFDHSSVLSLL
jgi:hypothetical protein